MIFSSLFSLVPLGAGFLFVGSRCWVFLVVTSYDKCTENLSHLFVRGEKLLASRILEVVLLEVSLQFLDAFSTASFFKKWKESKTKRFLVPRLHNRWKISKILEIHLVSNLRPATNPCFCMLHNIDSLSVNFSHILDETWMIIMNYGCLQLHAPKKVCFQFWTSECATYMIHKIYKISTTQLI